MSHLPDGRYLISGVYWGKAKRPHNLFIEVKNGVVRVATKTKTEWTWEVVDQPYLIRWITNHLRLETVLT